MLDGPRHLTAIHSPIYRDRSHTGNNIGITINPRISQHILPQQEYLRPARFSGSLYAKIRRISIEYGVVRYWVVGILLPVNRIYKGYSTNNHKIGRAQPGNLI